MKSVTGDMWVDERKILLAGLLDKVKFEHPPSWRVRKLDVWRAPFEGRSMEELCIEIETNLEGFWLSDSRLREFADGLNDMNEILVEGFFGSKHVATIEAHDSTYWIISYDLEGAHMTTN